jgi:hypothetical protein
MAKLIYSAITSLDGYVEDADGDRSSGRARTRRSHAFVNELERPIGTYLYGRRMYETMVYWETDTDDAPVAREYADIWRAAEKVVYSRTLRRCKRPNPHLATFEPDAMQRTEGVSGCRPERRRRQPRQPGPEHRPRRRAPSLLPRSIVGGGKRALPDQFHTRLKLLDERRFESGVVHLHYSLL